MGERQMINQLQFNEYQTFRLLYERQMQGTSDVHNHSHIIYPVILVRDY